METKKTAALLLVLAMVAVPFVSFTDGVDAAETEPDTSAAGGFLDYIMQIQSEGISVEFGDDSDENIEQIRAPLIRFLKQVTDDEFDENTLTTEDLASAIGMVANGVAGAITGLDSSGSACTMGPGSFKFAFQLPDAFYAMMAGSDDASLLTGTAGEVAIKLDTSFTFDATINQDASHIGLGGLGGITEGLKNNSILEKFFVISDPSAFDGLNTNISEGSVYTSTVDLDILLYGYLSTDTNYDGKGSLLDPSFYFNTNLGALGKACVDIDMTLKSGTGPEKISTGIGLSNLDIDLSFKIAPGQATPVKLQMNKIDLEVGYDVAADDEKKSTTITLANIIKLVNGVSIPLASEVPEIFNDIETGEINYEKKEVTPEQSAIIKEIVEEIKGDVEPEKTTVPYIAGGATAVLGLIGLIAVRKL